MLTFFGKHSEVQAIMSEKSDGSMRLPYTDVTPWELANFEPRKLFFEKHNIDPHQVILADLVHGKNAKRVTFESKPIQNETDALIAYEKGLYVSVTVADCLPIFLYDPQTGSVGIIHAGWRGLLDGIIAETVTGFRNMGCREENIRVAIGPHIQKCHFSIGSDIEERFSTYPQCMRKGDGKIFVDLSAIAQEQLLKERALETNIEVSQLCTYCEKDRFFSYRRDKPADVEAMVAVIGLKE